MGEFFDLATASDQLKKLEREYRHLQDHPGDVDTALSFFVTAAHFPEWVQDKAYKKKVLQQQLIVGICDELANLGKHSKRTKQHPLVLQTDYDAYVERDFIEEGFFEETLKVTLAPEAAEQLGLNGQTTDVVWLAARVIEFWRAHPTLAK
jgi:hypothetical protein